MKTNTMTDESFWERLFTVDPEVIKRLEGFRSSILQPVSNFYIQPNNVYVDIRPAGFDPDRMIPTTDRIFSNFLRAQFKSPKNNPMSQVGVAIICPELKINEMIAFEYFQHILNSVCPTYLMEESYIPKSAVYETNGFFYALAGYKMIEAQPGQWF